MTQTEIFLFQNGSAVEGHVGNDPTGPLAFTIDVSGSTVTLTQFLALHHLDSSDPNDTLTLDGIVHVTAMATDGDGDHATLTEPNGLNLTFYDDAPTASITEGKGSITIDESPDVQAGDSADPAPSAFSGYGTPLAWGHSGSAVVDTSGSDFGADGPGSKVLTLGPSGVGVDSGLIDAATGEHIYLYQDGDNVVGRIGDSGVADPAGAIAVAFHLESDGTLDTAEYRALQHPNGTNPDDSEGVSVVNGALVATVTVTDDDSDVASVSTGIGEHATFLDDGVSITSVTYNNEDNNRTSGELDEDFLGTTNSPGNNDLDTNPDNLNNPTSNGDAPGGTSVSGQINPSAAVDQPLAFAFDIAGLVNDGDMVAAQDADGNPLKSSAGNPITLTLSHVGSDWIVTGSYTDDSGSHDAFTVTLDSTNGQFTFHLIEALAHPDGNNIPGDDATDDGTARYEDNLNLDFGAKVIDKDGDSGSTTLHFTVNDDAPMLVTQPHVTSTDTGHQQVDQVDTFVAVVEAAPCLQESTCSVVINPDNQPSWVLSSITVKDENGNTQGDDSLFQQSGAGFGVVSSEDGGNGGRFDEVNFDHTANGGAGASESLIFNFGKLVESGTVELARFYSGEHGVGDEQGHWEAFRNGVKVGEGDFEAASTTGQFGFAIPTIAGGFDQLVFTAKEGSNLLPGTNDDSDYLVQQLNLNLLPTNSQQGEFEYKFGADNGNLPYDNVAGNGFTVSTAGINLTSGGQPVTMEQDVENGHIVVFGYKNGDHNEPVFKFDIDPNAASGSGGEHVAHYIFTEYAPLDNNGDMSNIPFDIKIQDRDGDAIQTTVSVCVDDSAPVVNDTMAGVFEKGLDQSGTGHDGTTKGDGSNVTGGFLNISYNGDGPGSITGIHFNGFAGVPTTGASDAASDGAGHWVINNALFNLTVDQITGAYTFTLKENIQHTDSADDGFTNVNGTNPTINPVDLVKDLGFAVTVKDGDGTTATGALVVHVTDDGPTAGDFNIGSFNEHAAKTDLGTVAAVFGSHYVAGADGLGNIAISTAGDATHGTLEISGGHVFYTPPSNVVGNQTFSFGYQVTDSDGDAAPANITVTVKDNVPTLTQLTPEGTPGVVSVYEAGLGTGSHIGNTTTTATGSFKIDTHGEGLGTLSLGGGAVIIAGPFPQTVHTDGLGDLKVTGISNVAGVYTVTYTYALTHNFLDDRCVRRPGGLQHPRACIRRCTGCLERRLWHLHGASGCRPGDRQYPDQRHIRRGWLFHAEDRVGCWRCCGRQRVQGRYRRWHPSYRGQWRCGLWLEVGR